MIRAAKTAVAWLICAAALAMVGCATVPLDKARQYTTGLADGGLAVGRFVATMNEQKEGEIATQVEDDGDAPKARRERDHWRRIYDGADKAIKTFGAGVGGLRAGIEIKAAMGGKIALGPIIAEGLKLWESLKAALKSYGIEVPGGNLL